MRDGRYPHTQNTRLVAPLASINTCAPENARGTKTCFGFCDHKNHCTYALFVRRRRRLRPCTQNLFLASVTCVCACVCMHARVRWRRILKWASRRGTTGEVRGNLLITRLSSETHCTYRGVPIIPFQQSISLFFSIRFLFLHGRTIIFTEQRNT